MYVLWVTWLQYELATDIFDTDTFLLNNRFKKNLPI